MFRCIDQIQPDWVVAENVAGILTMVEQGEVSEVASTADLFDTGDRVRGYRLRETFTLQRICDDLESHGYTVQPVLIPACAVGAPHRRDRVFIIGHRRSVPQDPVRSGQLVGLDGEQGSERNERNAGARDSERVCRETSRTEYGFTADTVGSGAGTSRKSGCAQSDGSDTDQQPSQWRAATEWSDRFYAILRHAADTDSRRVPRFCDNLKQCDERTIGQPIPDSEQSCTWDKQRWHSDGNEAGSGRWSGFPTVSAVHRGNDGLPFDVDDLTLPFGKWRTEALKAYGNAIVPQVMYEIFRAIDQIERN